MAQRTQKAIAYSFVTLTGSLLATTGEPPARWLTADQLTEGDIVNDNDDIPLVASEPEHTSTGITFDANVFGSVIAHAKKIPGKKRSHFFLNWIVLVVRAPTSLRSLL